MKGRIDAPLAILAVGFAFSLAANLMWTWPGGPVRIAGGALTSLALPAAVHLWPRIPADGSLRQALRAVVMTAIAVLAAYTTFSHASELLVLHGEEPLLAAAYPIMTELMVVMGALAHQAPRTGVRSTRRPVAPPAARPARGAPRARPAETSPATVGKRAKGLDWARENWPCTGKAIALAAGVSRAEGDRIRAKVKTEHQAAS